MNHFTPPFWLVWCEGGGAPTVKHGHYSKAKSEAQRLARMNPGRRFVVMAAVIGFQKRDLDETRFDLSIAINEPDFELDDHIPF